MTQHIVSIVRYRGKESSLRGALALSGALERVKPGMRVFIKPNIVVWSDQAVFPKWGVITTSRLIEDTVIALRERGVTDITIGEGIVTLDAKRTGVAARASRTLGYDELGARYGVRFIDVMQRPFEKVDIGVPADIRVNSDALHADFLINLPVLKTHAQTVVSLGMKNLKGLLNIASRKKFHSPDEATPLPLMISRLHRVLPPSATILDGIYTLERGPAPDGKARRSDIVITGDDTLSVDMIGARVLGHDPAAVPAIVHAARDAGRSADARDVVVRGETVESVAAYHEWDFPYNASNTLHAKMEKMGITGLSYPKYDDTMCTYCSIINGAVLTAIGFAWKGEAWDGVEILTGKKMEPTMGMNKTILLGQCMVHRHRNHPHISEAIPVRGCPPDPQETVAALHRAGIPVDAGIFENIEGSLGFFMLKYKDRPEFDESFYRVE